MGKSELKMYEQGLGIQSSLLQTGRVTIMVEK